MSTPAGIDPATGEVLAPLSDDDAADLERLEDIVGQGLDTFVQVGNALAEIRDRRLYRARHATFAAYCSEAWGMKKSRAYQLIAGAEVSTSVDIPPKNEAEARELGKVAPEHRNAVMEAATADGPATAPKIRDAAKKVAPPPEPEPDPEQEMDARQRRAADQAHNLADQLARHELVHDKTIRLMEARCKRWREQA